MNPERPEQPNQGVPAGTARGGVEPAQGAPDAIAPEQAPSGPDARLAEAEARVAEIRDQYLRAVAELDNVRRRAQDDVAKAHKYGIETFAESLLPVKDSLEMALKADTPSVDNLKEGVEATLRLLTSAFEKNRLLEIDPQGEKFDPNRHQAISTVPAAATQPPIAPNHVAHVLQKGYLIGDRVLRPALVTVVQG